MSIASNSSSKKRGRTLSIAIPYTKPPPVIPYTMTLFEDEPQLGTVGVVHCLGGRLPRTPCWDAIKDVTAEGLSQSVFAELWQGVRILINGAPEHLGRLEGVPERGLMVPMIRREPPPLAVDDGRFRRYDRQASPRPTGAAYPGVDSIYLLRGAQVGEGGALFILQHGCRPNRRSKNLGVLIVTHTCVPDAAKLAAGMVGAYNAKYCLCDDERLRAIRMAVFTIDSAGVSRRICSLSPLADLRKAFAQAAPDVVSSGWAP